MSTLDQPRPRRVTITDVAREAGVSVATVSKVINERYGVSEATAEKVLAVIDELGYQSSPLPGCSSDATPALPEA
jgi:LacI family transcriptional regulator